MEKCSMGKMVNESENDPDRVVRQFKMFSECKTPPAADHLTGGLYTAILIFGSGCG